VRANPGCGDPPRMGFAERDLSTFLDSMRSRVREPAGRSVRTSGSPTLHQERPFQVHDGLGTMMLDFLARP
jgi:hypothetical protein